MQESTRVSATIELLDQCEQVWKNPQRLPVDVILNRYFKDRRYIGSKDRGSISALFYLIIRNMAALEWHLQHSLEGSRALAIAALILIHKKSIQDLHLLFDGEKFSPAKLDKN